MAAAVLVALLILLPAVVGLTVAVLLGGGWCWYLERAERPLDAHPHVSANR